MQVWGSNLANFRPCKLEACKLATSKYEEASDTEANNEYEQEDPDQAARDMDGEQHHQQHLDEWQSNHPHYQYDDL